LLWAQRLVAAARKKVIVLALGIYRTAQAQFYNEPGDKKLGYGGGQKNQARFLKPCGRCPNGFGLAFFCPPPPNRILISGSRGVFTKLEYLILNHRFRSRPGFGVEAIERLFQGTGEAALTGKKAFKAPSCADPVQQVADDREGNSHAEPNRHEENPFINLLPQAHQSFNVHSLKVWHDDLLSRKSVIDLIAQINGPEA
jgi:hypothetical protein